MSPLLRKITIPFIAFIIIIIIVGNLNLQQKKEVNSSISVKSYSLNLQASSSAKNQSIKEVVVKNQPSKEQEAKTQLMKEHKAKEQLLNEQETKKQLLKEQAIKEQEAKKQALLAESKILDVPLINQLAAPELYNGCEITSLAMILNYNGYHVTKNELANNIKTVPLVYANGLRGNPNDGFVGNIQYGPGYAVYNGPIYHLARRFAGNKVTNLTGSPFSELLNEVKQGEPVWIITTATFSPVSSFKRWHTPEGTIDITFQEHSVAITGYDQNDIYINNPYGIKNERLNRSLFEKAWVQMGKQAIVIEK